MMDSILLVSTPIQSTNRARPRISAFIQHRLYYCPALGRTLLRIFQGIVVLILLLDSHSTVATADDLIADPARMLSTAERMDFVGANALTIEPGPAEACLRSTPRRSASGLYQRVNIAGDALRDVRWTWRVDRLQQAADVRSINTEDVGAMVMFVFGTPSIIHRDVPTLAYVWTATPVANGAFLRSQRFGSLVYVQLRGRAEVGRWQQESRNVADDFRVIFDRGPGKLRYVAVFNDNDHTNEATSALFCPVLVVR